MSTTDFYKKLPILEDFFDSSNPDLYQPVPADWHVALTDIVDSTSAIEQGRYKRVNMLGAAPIAGMFNHVEQNDIPYAFGGDGSMMAIPPRNVDDARNVLSTCKKIGAEAYNLDLRAAIIPVSTLYDKEKTLKVARFKVSNYYSQALFRGTAVRYSEKLLKDPDEAKFDVGVGAGEATAMFNNLECRWQEIKNQDKEVITLVVEKNPDLSEKANVYPQVLQKLRSIYGFDNKTNPITEAGLKMHKWVGKMKDEVIVRTFGMHWIKKFIYAATIQVQSLLGNLFMNTGFKGPKRNWGEYKSDFVRNSDHRKFNEMLSTVISGTREQREKLERFLEKLYKQKKLAYGMHITDSAIVTCMVFEYYHEHVHFVDGSKGGYVKASKELKKRRENLLKSGE